MSRASIDFEVTDTDRAELEAWLRASNTKRSLANRARIVLEFSSGLSGRKVAEKVGVSLPTTYKWLHRYREGGIEALRDLPRPGQPRKLDEEGAKRILKLTVETIPHESTHWSLRLMAKYAGVTRHQVQKVWSAAGLKPHLYRQFKISTDPEFAEKVIDVVGLYMDPPDNAMVLSVDEKTQIQALDRTQPLLQLRPGQVERRTHDYKRHGTVSLYAAFDIATNHVIGRITKRHRAKEFLSFLQQIDRMVPKALDIHMILDNSSTHKTAEVHAWLAAHPRFHLHFTPTSASWLNAVESWFSKLERQALYRNAFKGLQALRDEIRRYINVNNSEPPRPFRWTVDAASIISKVDRLKKAVGFDTN